MAHEIKIGDPVRLLGEHVFRADPAMYGYGKPHRVPAGVVCSVGDIQRDEQTGQQLYQLITLLVPTPPGYAWLDREKFCLQKIRKRRT